MGEKRPEDFAGLLERYGKRKHPLEYRNRYQLVVMVVLSGNDSDRHVNALAPGLFAAYPTLRSLAAATSEDLLAHIGTAAPGGAVNRAPDKAERLIAFAKAIGDDERIPRRFGELTAFDGIGPKTANVIIRESGDAAEGVIVDLHVLRVAPRIGIAAGKTAPTIERQLKALFPPERWNEVGMALSFLGRELCRPTKPKCDLCPVARVCDHRNGPAGAQSELSF